MFQSTNNWFRPRQGFCPRSAAFAKNETKAAKTTKEQGASESYQAVKFGGLVDTLAIEAINPNSQWVKNQVVISASF